MKKWIMVLIVTLMLCGCGREELPVMETVDPQACEQNVKPEPGQIGLLLPEQAISQTMTDSSGDQLYTWDDHTLQLQTLDGGDIRSTVKNLTGFSMDDLTVMQYRKGDMTYYQTVWSTAGEEGSLVGRALIADDGVYHYCMSLISPEDSQAGPVYEQLCATFSVRNGDDGK